MIVKVGTVEHDLRVEAAFSVPRLGFQDQMFCAFQALMPLNILPTKYTGAFWEQCLDRVLLSMMDRTDWILVLDYDSIFDSETVMRLMMVAMSTGYDAVAPLQSKRDEGSPMFTPVGAKGIGKIELPTTWFEELVQPVDSAHFGCTLLRSEALRRMKTPWFIGKPAGDGHYGDAVAGKKTRVDPDISFWRQWKASGNTLGVAPQISIGHAELMITWLGRDLRPINQYPATYWRDGGKRPAGAWGSVEHAQECSK